ncbi:MAG: hypothetical protein ACFFCW_43485 [Candidatus Hodarchaeota archaeon]
MKKKISLFFVLGCIFVLLPVWATAATVEGTIQGYDCVVTGTVCPTGREDPYVSTQSIFIVLTEAKDYYFIPNIDRAVLARHVNQKVRVTGKMSSKYNSIMAETIEVMEKGSWKTAWSIEEQRKMWSETY